MPAFKCPPGFRESQKRVDKLSGKSSENDFEVWLVDFIEATTDCMWTDDDRTHWFSRFCLTLQRLPGKELIQQKTEHHGRG